MRPGPRACDGGGCAHLGAPSPNARSVFTGLIETTAPLRAVERRGSGLALWIPAPGGDWSLHGGESIAVSGACLTVAGLRDPGTLLPAAPGTTGAELLFELSAETLARTWFGNLEPGRHVNLERALKLGDRLDGHLVSGHVDAVGRVVAVRDAQDGGRMIEFEVPTELERFLVDKGSLAIDGVSLTVVNPRGRRFDVALIPATLSKTTLGSSQPGDPVNMEADQLGKWIDRLLAARSS